MTKKNSSETTMRRVAGVFYGLLAVYQAFIIRVIFNEAGVANLSVTMLLECLLVLGAAALCVWFLSGDKGFSQMFRRAVGVSTVLYILYLLLTFETQTFMVSYSISGWENSLILQHLYPFFQGSELWQYVFVFLRLVIMILAAFFVISSKPAEEYQAEEMAEKIAGNLLAETVVEAEVAQAVEAVEEIEAEAVAEVAVGKDAVVVVAEEPAEEVK